MQGVVIAVWSDGEAYELLFDRWKKLQSVPHSRIPGNPPLDL